jgi:alkanesulfonate monooxygenase SsuD/methylene tetrahydromethanopterin reductase-like flavin-dependent oxidoreductase (luciferase family)
MLEPQEGMSVDEIVDWAGYAERSGYGFIFRSDHLLPTSGAEKKMPSPECWTSLGAVAAKTSRVKFGPMVSPIGFRNPAILATIACSLYAYSKGRAILGVGAGWYRSEYEAYGINFPDVQQRKEEFHEALQIMRPLTNGEHASFKGKHFSANVDCFPKPDPKIHFIVGGRDSQIVGWAGEFADELNMYSPSKKQVEKAKRILGGKDHIVLSQMAPFFIGESDSDLKGRVKRYLESNGLQEKVEDQISEFKQSGILCGTPDDFTAQLNEKRETGLRRFYFQLADPSDKAAAEVLTKTLRKI